jgi:hypothetical protein
MLEALLEETRRAGREFLNAKAKSRLTELKFSGMGVAREFKKEAKPSWRSQMTDILEELNAQEIGLLLTVDEVDSGLSEMVTLVSDYQMFIREKREVALLMAGLPSEVSLLLQVKSISFLRRAFQKRVESISLPDAKRALRMTIEASGRRIGSTGLLTAARASGGFPFLIQLIGYHIWQQSPEKEEVSDLDVDEGINDAFFDMERMIFETTVKELSNRDMEFLEAMLQDREKSEMAHIAARMGVSDSYASQYRLRLIEQGVIEPVNRGKVAFALPMLREYLTSRLQGNRN